MDFSKVPHVNPKKNPWPGAKQNGLCFTLFSQKLSDLDLTGVAMMVHPGSATKMAIFIGLDGD